MDLGRESVRGSVAESRTLVVAIPRRDGARDQEASGFPDVPEACAPFLLGGSDLVAQYSQCLQGCGDGACLGGVGEEGEASLRVPLSGANLSLHGTRLLQPQQCGGNRLRCNAMIQSSWLPNWRWYWYRNNRSH